MQIVPLTSSGDSNFPLIYGCMRLGGPNWDDTPLTDEQRDVAYTALDSAFEQGFRLFDHADIYMAGKSEAVFGNYIRERKIARDTILIQTKCGLGRMNGTPFYNFSSDHIQRQVESSIERLDCDYLDILLLHRPDVLARPQEVAKVFSHLHDSGLVRYYGTSNFTPAQWDTFSRHIDQKLIINQIPLSILRTNVIDAELNWFEGDPIGVSGLLHHATNHKITIQAYAPLCCGRLSDDHNDTEAYGRDLLHARQVVKEVAENYGVSVTTLLVAFLLRLPHYIQPVIGTTNPQRIKESVAAIGLEIERPHFYQLLEAGRPGFLP